MNAPVTAVILSALALWGSNSLAAQEHPDFTGKWQFDLSRSSAPVTPPPTMRPNGQGSRIPFIVGRAPSDGSGSAPPNRTVEQTRPNDPNSEGGLYPGARNEVEQTLDLTLGDGTLKIEQITNGIKEKFAFKLDGSESKNQHYVGGAKVAVKAHAQWDGTALVIDGSGVQKTDRGSATVTITQRFTLSEDGATLTIDDVVQSDSGKIRRVFVYTRQ